MDLNLLLQRTIKTSDSTIGKLFIDGVFECWTLEDVIREIEGEPVSSWKIKGMTAIPVGTYEITLYNSPKFGAIVPMLNGVDGYTYVLIHWGNKSKDTDGCILVGQTHSTDFIGSSKNAFKALFPKIKHAIESGQKVWLTIQ